MKTINEKKANNVLAQTSVQKINVIRMALLFVASLIGFTACSSDDEIELKTDKETGIVTSEKKLVQWAITQSFDSGDYTNTYTFEYDNKGRLSKVKITNDEGRNERTYYMSWGDNIVSSPWYDNIASSPWYEDNIGETNKTNYTYTLENGRVTKAIKEYIATNGATSSREHITRNYIYDDERRLFKVEENDTYTDNKFHSLHSYTWLNNQLVKYGYVTYEDYTYTYSDKTCKGFCPIQGDVALNYHSEILFMVHPELIGMRRTQLPDKIVSKDDRERTFSYTFDKDHYVTSITETEKIGMSQNQRIKTYAYVWE